VKDSAKSDKYRFPNLRDFSFVYIKAAIANNAGRCKIKSARKRYVCVQAVKERMGTKLMTDCDFMWQLQTVTFIVRSLRLAAAYCQVKLFVVSNQLLTMSRQVQWVILIACRYEWQNYHSTVANNARTPRLRVAHNAAGANLEKWADNSATGEYQPDHNWLLITRFFKDENVVPKHIASNLNLADLCALNLFAINLIDMRQMSINGVGDM